jgi:hypothetical protein
VYVKERKISLGRREEGREEGNRAKEKGVEKRRREMRWEKLDIKGGEMGKWEEKGLGKQYRK